MDYNEALKIVQTGKMADVKDVPELRSGLVALYLLYGNNRDHTVKVAIESFENEISQRVQLAGATALHLQQMEQGKKIHLESIAEQQRLHGIQIAELQRLHTAQIEAVVGLDKKSLVEESGRHKKTQCVAWLAVGIAFVTLVFAVLGYVHDLTAANPSKATQALPPLLGTLTPTETPSILTNALPANFLSANNQAQPKTNKLNDKK